jgi:hypothetical protein
MKTLQRNPRNSINRSFACIPQRSSLLLLVTANILLTSVNVFGTTNHPPAVSWIKDQAITTGGSNKNLSLTPDFSPVITGSREWKPFKRLLPCGRAGTRLKPDVNEK